jgi:hypothetical protein
MVLPLGGADGSGVETLIFAGVFRWAATLACAVLTPAELDAESLPEGDDTDDVGWPAAPPDVPEPQAVANIASALSIAPRTSLTLLRESMA